MPHAVNWYAGWMMILLSFLIGAAIGLWFHRDDFLGGYSSWRRRLLRLGHIALAALGITNLLFSMNPFTGSAISLAGALLIAGGFAMPAVCFLSAWKKSFKGWFALPVATLCAAVALILLN